MRHAEPQEPGWQLFAWANNDDPHRVPYLGRESQPSMRSVRWAFSRSVKAWKTLLYSLDSRVISSVGSCSS